MLHAPIKGPNFKAFRLEHKLSQVKVAEACVCDPRTIRSFEAGKFWLDGLPPDKYEWLKTKFPDKNWRSLEHPASSPGKPQRDDLWEALSACSVLLPERPREICVGLLRPHLQAGLSVPGFPDREEFIRLLQSNIAERFQEVGQFWHSYCHGVSAVVKEYRKWQEGIEKELSALRLKALRAEIRVDEARVRRDLQTQTPFWGNWNSGARRDCPFCSSQKCPTGGINDEAPLRLRELVTRRLDPRYSYPDGITHVEEWQVSLICSERFLAETVEGSFRNPQCWAYQLGAKHAYGPGPYPLPFLEKMAWRQPA